MSGDYDEDEYRLSVFASCSTAFFANAQLMQVHAAFRLAHARILQPASAWRLYLTQLAQLAHTRCSYRIQRLRAYTRHKLIQNFRQSMHASRCMLHSNVVQSLKCCAKPQMLCRASNAVACAMLCNAVQSVFFCVSAVSDSRVQSRVLPVTGNLFQLTGRRLN